MVSLNEDLAQKAQRAQKANVVDIRDYARENFQQEKKTNPDRELHVDLGNHVLQAFKEAKYHKQQMGVTEQLHINHRQYHSRYEQREIGLMGGRETAVFWPLTNRIVRTMVAFLRKTLAGSDIEHPQFDLAPSTIPDPPADLVQRAEQAVLDQIILSLEAGLQFDEDEIRNILIELADSLYENVRDETFKAVKRGKREVEDALTHAKWEKVFDNFLTDLAVSGTGIIFGPYPEARKRQYFTETDIKTRTEIHPAFKNVDPNMFFPSPCSTDPQDGAYCIWLDPMTRKEVSDLRHLEGFFDDAICAVLETFEDQTRSWCAGVGGSGNKSDNKSAPSLDLSDLMSQIDDAAGFKIKPWSQTQEKIDVVKYFGCVSGRLLKLHNISEFDGKAIDEKESYEVEIWAIKNLIIRVNCNIDPLCERPFSKAVLFDCVGRFWGIGTPELIRDLQRSANAAFRHFIRNMGFAGAPMFEIDKALMAKGAKLDVYPGKVFEKNSLKTSISGTALQVHQIDSRANEFLDVIARMTESAEMLAGLPRFLTGDHQGGGAARTLGGLNQLTQNAAVQIRSTILNIDLDIIKPLISRLYRWIINDADDPRLYGDVEVVTMGASALLSREVNKEKLMSLIGILMPFVQSGHVRQEGINHVLSEILIEFGLDPDVILTDPIEVQRLSEVFRTNLGAASNISGGIANAALGTAGGAGVQADPGLAQQSLGTPPLPTQGIQPPLPPEIIQAA